MNSEPSPGGPIDLGIECGATHSVALLADDADHLIERCEFGPANFHLVSDAQLIGHFQAIRSRLPVPSAIAIGMAGARTEADWARIRAAAGKVWPGVPCYATNDLETGLMAADQNGNGGVAARRGSDRPAGRPAPSPRRRIGREIARVLVLSGTGSCCFGRAVNGRTAKVGGWGHILGDQGSGYAIGRHALRRVVHQYDCDGSWPRLGQGILRALQMNHPEDLVAWAQAAPKPDIAALAVEVFHAAKRRDPLARQILTDAAERLAADGAACAQRVARAGDPVQFVLAGSILLKQPEFAEAVAQRLRGLWRSARISPLSRESAWGAVALARQLRAGKARAGEKGDREPQPKASPPPAAAASASDLTRAMLQSPTEQRNPRSMNLDRLPVGKAIALMLSEDAKIPAALMAERAWIERAIGLIVRALRNGGRLFYVGAGTSGRLGVLDASECPPTFSVSPDLVQGIIAGGQNALWQSCEGAEDDPVAGAQALTGRGVTRRDVVVGIAASGRTPFVWGALREAKRRGAATVLVCFNPHVAIARADQPQVVIAPNVDPEVLTGSTRLKAGTATKLVLNLFTTLAMVRLGKVRSNLMVDVKASNVKLRDRAVRILQALTGAEYGRAQEALEGVQWNIVRACERLGRRGRTRK